MVSAAQIGQITRVCARYGSIRRDTSVIQNGGSRVSCELEGDHEPYAGDAARGADGQPSGCPAGSTASALACTARRARDASACSAPTATTRSSRPYAVPAARTPARQVPGHSDVSQDDLAEHIAVSAERLKAAAFIVPDQVRGPAAPNGQSKPRGSRWSALPDERP